MARTIRRFLATWLAALYATVMLCGTCLHALPGWGHDAGVEASSQDDRSPAYGGEPHESVDHCPICHFFAQGQLPVESSRASSISVVIEQRSIARLALPSPPPHRLPRPRAPPIAAGNPS